MKKKISFLTKVFLVIAMLFSDLSSLSVVFAYDETNVILNVENENIVVSYTDELEDTDEVIARIIENYTYLDSSSESELDYSETLTASELTQEGGVEIASQMLSNVKFDGLYELKVELYSDDTLEEKIGENTYSFNKEFEEGFKVTVFDENNEEILPVEDVYNFDTDKITIKLKLNSGKLNPTGTYYYEEEEFTTSELLEKEFEFEEDFSEALKGEYDIPELLTIDSLEEEKSIVYDEAIKVKYGEYSSNAEDLNMLFGNFANKYVFESEEKDGVFYVYDLESEELLVKDVIQIIYNAYKDKYGLNFSHSTNEDILDSFDSENELLEDYLDGIKLDNTFVVSISYRGLTITFKAVVVGDVNNDGVVNEDDFDEIIKEVISENDANLEQDYNGDGEIDVYDAAILRKILTDGEYSSISDNVDGNIQGKLEVSEEDITSGDEITVDYSLIIKEDEINAFEGKVEYDHEMLELLDITNNTEFKGSSYEEKFAYVGESTLTGKETTVEEETTIEEEQEEVLPEEESKEEEISLDEEQEENEEEISYEEQEYVVLTFKFKTLKAGTSEISIVDSKFANGETQVIVEDYEAKVEVTVNEASDNTLATLKVNDEEITLEEDKLDYTLSVKNEITKAEIEAIVSNVAANISSIVGPEELSEGENVFTITVVAENGDEKIYTITVTREKKEETVTAVSYNNTINNTVEEETITLDDDEDDDVVETPEETEEDSDSVSRIIIVILILLVIAGLIYLIFKDDEDDETKKTNKQIDKMKKDNDFPEEKKVVEKTNNTKEKVQSTKENSNKKQNTTNKNNQKKNNSKKGR